jgi:hypothetical protein
MLSTSSYLQNRNGHYHLRLKIPSDLSSLKHYEIATMKETNDILHSEGVEFHDLTLSSN